MWKMRSERAEWCFCCWFAAWRSAVASCSCGAGPPGAQGDAVGVEIAADGIGMDAELMADGGTGLAGEVTLLGLAFLFVVQTMRPTGDVAGIVEVADLLLADAIALADLAHRYAPLVEGDYLVFLRRRRGGGAAMVVVVGVVAPSSVGAGAAAVGTLPLVVAVAAGTSPSGGNVLANSSSVCQFLVTEEQRPTFYIVQ